MEFVLLILVVVFLTGGIIYFASRRPEYSHIRCTISELGEDGAPNNRKVNLLLFLPVGLLLLLIGTITDNQYYGRALSLCIGGGYLISALFPCDPGSPLYGSDKQMMHNVAGIIEYGGGIYYMNAAGHPLFASIPVNPQWITVLLIACIIFTPFPEFKLRGLFQRILELVLFCQLCWIISG